MALIRDLSYPVRDGLEYDEAIANLRIIAEVARILDDIKDLLGRQKSVPAIQRFRVNLSKFVYANPEYKGYFAEGILISKETLKKFKLL